MVFTPSRYTHLFDVIEAAGQHKYGDDWSFANPLQCRVVLEAMRELFVGDPGSENADAVALWRAKRKKFERVSAGAWILVEPEHLLAEAIFSRAAIAAIPRLDWLMLPNKALLDDLQRRREHRPLNALLVRVTDVPRLIDAVAKAQPSEKVLDRMALIAIIQQAVGEFFELHAAAPEMPEWARAVPDGITPARWALIWPPYEARCAPLKRAPPFENKMKKSGKEESDREWMKSEVMAPYKIKYRELAALRRARWGKQRRGPRGIAPKPPTHDRNTSKTAK